jgi:hypothetical protein
LLLCRWLKAQLWPDRAAAPIYPAQRRQLGVVAGNGWIFRLFSALQLVARSDMAAVTVREGYLDLSHRIEVTDQAGELILDLHFRNAVRIKQ